MRVFLRSSFACLLLLLSSACEFHSGDGRFDWDGSIWDDDDDAGPRKPDASHRDAQSEDQDAGPSPDSSEPTPIPIDSGEPNEPTLTADDVPNILARGRCGALEACLGGETLLTPIYEGNDCVEFTTRQQSDRQLHYLNASVASGRVKFRPAELEACRAAIVAMSCDVASRPLPAACEEAIEGQANLGRDCNIDQDCVGNAYCYKGTQETCPGQCVGLQGPGLPCTSSSQCADRLMCLGGSCESPPLEGDACNTRFSPGECPPGLVCQGASGALKCQSVKTLYSAKLDEPCDVFGQLCQLGLVCQSANSTNTIGGCKRLAAAGETCRPAEPSQCPPTQYCKDARSDVMDRAGAGKDGVCADRPRAGQSCQYYDCVPGARCIDGTCYALQTAPNACTSGNNAECYGGLCEQNQCLVNALDCND